ncbi:putative ATPase/DNA-binding SARP family transcriptional activator [Kibdelosporangium banguiense]|uniref:ATPase/DNA-binding SARP family transcriptional activator n=1 Tax=Kibdelosporangium banguiense TaxID=1365924 RepID=A0ABS4TA87_9PSEU|nr:BTAD domain-containing putative transcriptional regulator [Kibdelosporangium banguiense]MBP2321332.1 putative ATPase/DNA-binding SARP family transcriptional activator [Kibdelosporangium banguiense]
MRVAVLGPLSLRDGADREIEVGGPRLRMLLVRLALEAGRVVPSESLINSLWGEQPPSDATNALQTLVSRLRRAGIAKLLESHAVGYSLAVTDVDAHTFERLAAEGSRLLKAGQTTEAAEVLREALGLWRGPALVDVAEAPFAAPAVARLAELRLTAIEDRIEADISRGHESGVIVELYALTREHPLRERLAALLIRALHHAGRQADALAAYETARQNLAGELGVDPGPELQEVHLTVLRAKSAEVPGGGTRLPAQLTSFVGRQRELSELSGLLMADRLVTLIGPGGAGKTRLATEAATRMPGRVWFVPLAGLREAVDVPVALAAALGIGDSPIPEAAHVWPHRHPDVTKRLLDALANRADLVILDNCEHVISAAAHLADTLLAGCPRLRILATSRESLAITGETLLQVGPLELPDEHTSPEQAITHAAVRLLVDRAASVRPGFTVDTSNFHDVVSICHQLDGLPLALELAAARLRSMTVSQVAERLDDRFRLLSGGSRTSLPRHQTLGAVVEWSWGLLTDFERILATRLSVFAGAATLDAITAVCTGDDLSPNDVLYVLASLVEKSFVEAQEGADGPPRYRMLQTVRAFAGERLTDADAVRAKLAAYYLTLVEEMDSGLRGHEQLKCLAVVDAERDNIVAAVRVAVDKGDADTSYRIVAGWVWYWLLRQGIFGESLSEQLMPVERMLELESEAPPGPLLMVRALALSIGIDEPVVSQFQRIAEICADLGDELLTGRALIEPMAYVMMGNLDKAHEAFRRSLRCSDPWARATSALIGALAAENNGAMDTAERWFAGLIRRYRRLGDRWGLMMALNGLAGIRSMHGDITAAIELHTEAWRVEAELGPLAEPTMTMSRLGDQYYRIGDLERARQQQESALAGALRQGQQAISVAIRCRLAGVLKAGGDLAGAREQIAAAHAVLAARPESSEDPMLHWVATVEVFTLTAEGDLERARQVALAALNGVSKQTMAYLYDTQSTADVAEALAVIAAAAGDLTLAARLLGASAVIGGAQDMGSPDVRAVIDLFGPAELEVLAAARKMPMDEARALLRESASAPPDPEAPSTG